MTPAEIQSTIEQMLSVQRQIQESQIKNTDNIARLESQTQSNSQLIRENSRLIREFAGDTREDIALLVEEIAKLAVDQREKFNQFYGYHIAADSERLNIIERLNKVEQEVERLKGRLDNESN